MPLVKEELSDLLNVVLNREQKEGQSRAEQNALAMAIECGQYSAFAPLGPAYKEKDFLYTSRVKGDK